MACFHKPELSTRIRINQVGYYPAAEKTAVITGQVSGKFFVRNVVTNKIVKKGVLSEPHQSMFADKSSVIASFSDITIPGIYTIELPQVGRSYPFTICDSIFNAIATAALKAYYYQRASCSITSEYGGKWVREKGHPDDKVFVHTSAATAERPKDFVISSPKGWYDAGDYNKYIVNSGFTVGVLLALYEDYSEYMNRICTNIPESKNQTPDILDELYWNIAWMLTMQDPNDGGVYHKLTTPSFEGMIAPDKCKKPRYVVQKSVTATLDFAASLAQAARVFKNFSDDYPGLADKLLDAAEKAYKWALQHSEAYYNQEQNNKTYKPEIFTGEYGDLSAKDEFFWAATELWITTRHNKYGQDVKKYCPDSYHLASWSQVSTLGYFTILRNAVQIKKEAPDLYNRIKDLILSYADNNCRDVEKSYFYAPYGRKAKDFFWGSTSDGAASQGITLMYAYRLTQNTKYLTNALRNLDYILGKNGTGYCYVTGFGSFYPKHPHHRLSVSDTIEDPIPGLLVGGPNPGQQDKCKYPSDIPDESYADIQGSYASNEIAINWNSTFTYLAASIDASF